MKNIVNVALLLWTGGCTTVSSITINQIPSKKYRDKKIHTEDSSPIILGIPFGSGYVDSARQEFVAKCSQGKIEGTVAKTYSKNYFLGFFVTQNVSFDGYCVEKMAKADHESVGTEASTTTSKKRDRLHKKSKVGKRKR